MSITLPNYYGFDVDKACKLLNADMYLGTFCVKGNYKPIAMFYSSKPDKSKGHKPFPGLFMQAPPEGGDSKLYVTGFEFKDIEQDLRQYGLRCLHCNDIIYSVNRHDYRGCSCGKCFVDGGKDYFKRAGNPSDYEVGIIDFMDRKFYPREYAEREQFKPDLSLPSKKTKAKSRVRGRPTKQKKSKS